MNLLRLQIEGQNKSMELTLPVSTVQTAAAAVGVWECFLLDTLCPLVPINAWFESQSLAPRHTAKVKVVSQTCQRTPWSPDLNPIEGLDVVEQEVCSMDLIYDAMFFNTAQRLWESF